MRNNIYEAVMMLLLITFDFWTVKNVTGRLLVGLRYTSRFEGENEI